MRTGIVYQAIMVLACVAAYLISRQTQRGLQLKRNEKLAILASAFCGAMIGAKLPFALFDWENLLNGRAWFSDGKTIICGLAGGYLGVEIAKWTLDIKTRTGDSLAVPVATAIAIGRWGCFHAGCCYGTPTDLPWGVVFATAADDLPRHPTQIYESIFHAVAAVTLWGMLRRGMFQGHLVKLYIMVYAVYRFGSEFIRPEARIFAGLTAYQWASCGLIIILAGLWYRDDRNAAAISAVATD